jgi:hypothetical protein
MGRPPKIFPDLVVAIVLRSARFVGGCDGQAENEAEENPFARFS